MKPGEAIKIYLKLISPYTSVISTGNMESLGISLGYSKSSSLGSISYLEGNNKW